MFSAILRELLLPVVIFLLLRSLLRGIFASLRPHTRTAAQQGQQTVQAGGVLKKDPVCGTYVSTDTAVTKTVDGEAVYFCSKECAEKFKG